MNKTINLCVFIVIMYVLGILIAKEYATFKQKPITVDYQPQSR